MTIEDKIQLFFRDPIEVTADRTLHATLYLLRRDIYTCFGYNPNDQSKISYQALFPGTMAIMAGIDLLAKFYYTDEDQKGNYSGDRFKKFTAQYVDNQYQEELYQLRNSLLHSFGLYAKRKGVAGKEYRFVLKRGLKHLVEKLEQNRYLVDIEMLRRKFEDAALQYERDLRSSKELQNIFETMFSKYGNIEIKPSI